MVAGSKRLSVPLRGKWLTGIGFSLGFSFDSYTYHSTFPTNKRILSLLPPDYRPQQIRLSDTQAVWIVKNTQDHTCYAAMFNLSDQALEIIVSQEDLCLEEVGLEALTGTLLDLWTGEESTFTHGHLHATLAPHACVIWQLLL